MTNERTVYDRIFESVFLMAWRHAEHHAVPIDDTSGRQPTANEIRHVAKYAAMMAGMAEVEARMARDLDPFKDALVELKAAAGDILISFNSDTECRIPGHQVERLFRAVHGQDAKLPWDLTNTQEKGHE